VETFLYRRLSGRVNTECELTCNVKVKLHQCLTKHHTMKTYGVVEV